METLRLRTPAESYNVALFVDYALTRDQTLRFGYYDNDNVRRNVGVGDYDALERAYTSKNGLRYYRIQHAGPIGRRIFIDNRLFVGAFRNEAASAVEAPTTRVLDAWTSGGAQQRGSSLQRAFQHASDLDYIRGKHSWRTGVLLLGVRPDSTMETNYLGTFTFLNREAYEAGAPWLYTRFIGEPLVKYFDFEAGAYIQDDIRVSKGLTVSPGVRISQARLRQTTAIEQYQLARHDVGYAFVDELNRQGYAKPPTAELVRAGQHGVQLIYLQEMGALGFRLGSLAPLIQLRDHGVTPEYVRELAALGYKGLPADEVRRARDHGVTAEFVREMAALGYSKLPLESLIRVRDHGVTPTYVREVKALGYDQMAIEDLVTLRDHGLTVDRIKAANARAGTRLPIDMLKSFAAGGMR